MTKRFAKNNDAFLCAQCGRSVPPAERTCRDHCPFCLYSKHVDIFPGDRLAECKQLMEPVGYEMNSKKGLMIHYRCTGCNYRHRNIALTDQETNLFADDYDQIMRLGPLV